MSLHRILSIPVFVFLAAALGSEALAQRYHIGDIQLFRPAQITDYGDEPHSNYGFYFAVDYLGYHMSAPKRGLVGANISRQVFNFSVGDGTTQGGGGLAIATSDMDTAGFDARYHSGERIDFGYMDKDGTGWGMSTFNIHGKTTSLYGSHVSVLFNDPQNLNNGFLDITGPAGTPDGFDDDLNSNNVYGRNGIDTSVPLDGTPDSPFPTDNNDRVTFPMNFNSVVIRLKSRTYSTDVQRTWRTGGGQFGGWVDWGVGGRFTGFRDQFSFSGFGGVLADTFISQNIANNIIAPQFSLRWFNICYRWTYSADLRIAPGVNFQSIQQRSTIGSSITPGAGNQPLGLSPMGASNTLHITEFSPVIDIRLGVGYKITDYITARVGVNTVYMDGIARSPNMINYTLPNAGIITANNTQPVFLYGLNVGFEINR